MILASNL